MYLFDWESPAFGGILGACHALELPFVFGAVHLPVVQVFSGSGPVVERLSRDMQRAWLPLPRTGVRSRRRRRVAGMGPGAPRNHDLWGHTRLEDAPRNEELAVIERARPLVSGVPG